MVPQKKPRTFKEKLFANEPPSRQPPRITGGVRNAGYRILAQTANASYSIPPAAFPSNTSPTAHARSAGSSFSSSASLPLAVRDLRNSHTRHTGTNFAPNEPSRSDSRASTIRPSSNYFNPIPSLNDKGLDSLHHSAPQALVRVSAANSTPLRSNTGSWRRRKDQAEEGRSDPPHNTQSTEEQRERGAPSRFDLIDADDWGAPPRPSPRAASTALQRASEELNPGIPSPSRTATIWEDSHFGLSSHHSAHYHPTQQTSLGGPSTPSFFNLHTLSSTLTPPSAATRKAPWRTDRSSSSTASIDQAEGVTDDIVTFSQPSPDATSEITDGLDNMVSPRTVDEVLMSLRGRIMDEQERGKGSQRSRARDRDDDDDRDRYYSKGYDRLDGGRKSKLSHRRGRERSAERGESRPERYRDSSREQSRDREKEVGRERDRDRAKEAIRDKEREREHEEVRRSRGQKEEEMDALKEENETYKRDVDRLTARLDRVLAEREDLRAADSTSASDIRSLRKRNEKLESLLEESQSKLTDLQRHVALSSPSPRRPNQQDKAALSALAEEVESLRADKATLDFKLKSLGQVLEEEKAARKQSDNDAHSTRVQQSQMAQQWSELESRLQGMGKELASQQRARQLAVDRMREMEGLIGNLEAFKQELTSAKKQNEELKQSLQVEKNRVTYANDRYDGKQKQFEDQQDKVRSIRRENDALQAEKKEFESKIAKYRDQGKYHSKALESLHDCRKMNERMKRDQRDMKEKLADARSEITRLNRVLDDQQRAVARLQESRSSSQSRAASFDDDSDDTDGPAPVVKARVTAEERFRSYRELGEKAPTRPRTAVPHEYTDGNEGPALPTLASGLNGSILQPDNKREPTPFDPAPIKYDLHRSKSRMANSSGNNGTRPASAQPNPPGGIDWRVITPARPKSAASNQSFILETDVRMSDSDSETKSQAPPVSLSPVYETEDELVTNNNQAQQNATPTSKSAPIMLDNTDEPEITPIRPAEATLGFETPAPL